LSWVSENADLFAGDIHEIIPFGFGAGASYLLRLALYRGYQVRDDAIAGLVLISGVFGQNGRASDLERINLTDIRVPIVLAWSTSDSAGVKMTNEDLKKRMCDAGHCPRSVVLAAPSSPGSGFDLDGFSPDLHDRVRQLIAQLDARGLP
jgi:acetyl esterase/lipase